MWKTLDGYTLTMPQSELESLAAEFSGGGCGCKGCAISAVAQELGSRISRTSLKPKRGGAAQKKRTTRSRRTTARGGGSANANANQGNSDTFSGGSGGSQYQFHTRRLPGRRRWIYAYTPPPWASAPPPPPPTPAAPDCSPDDPSCGQAPDDGSAPDNGGDSELNGTILGALVRGG